MKKTARLIILLVCVVCFLLVAPILVFYSMGDRFDFANMRITATGGIYIRTFPAAEQIIIDSKISGKPNIFSNSLFVQSLLPTNHSVLIKKSGYYDYSKTLPVQENQVTKLENVLLFKKNIGFEIVATKTNSPFSVQEKFVIKNNNLYYSNSPDNSGLTALQKSTPILKKIISFTPINNNIIWIATDGFLYKSDLNNLAVAPLKITLSPIKIIKTGSYKIITDGKYIFVNNNGELQSFNALTSELVDFHGPVKDARISPEGKNIIYFNDKEVYISALADKTDKKTILFNSPNKINDCIWLNNDHIIIATANKIIISEIDYRGSINSVTMPQTAIIYPDKKITIENPKIYFNQQEGKLYVLTGVNLLSSEKITP